MLAGYATEGRVEILEGLEVGQRVVTSGKGSISDHTLIEIINDTEESDEASLVEGGEDDSLEKDSEAEQSQDSETTTP